MVGGNKANAWGAVQSQAFFKKLENINVDYEKCLAHFSYPICNCIHDANQ